MNNKELYQQTLEELALIVMYLSRYRESDSYSCDDEPWRCFKNYDYGVVNNLNDEGFILDRTHRSNSFAITKKGEAKVFELLKKYNIDQNIL